MNPLNGRMKVVESDLVSTGGVWMHVPLRPPTAGIEWEIVWAVGKHDDPGGTDRASWGFYDPDCPAGAFAPGTTLTPGEYLPLGAVLRDGESVGIGPIFATRDRYPSFQWLASGVGNTGTITAMVIERVGALA